jgi:alpha-1,3-mannosyl-glycoprotein beta-1,2-N-acetylglucosaminyltransferase
MSTAKRVVPLIVFAYNRGHMLRRTLTEVFKYLPADGSIRVIVSQDGYDQSVPDAVSKFPGVTLWQHPHELDHAVPPGEAPSYHFIATHYKRGLTKVFLEPEKYEAVIILEEDVSVAPDFFEYMLSMLNVLQDDDSLYCVSAFNDNGKAEHVQDPMSLYRTDFFPGLGWMLSRDVWSEWDGQFVAPGGGYWDEWVRLPRIRKGRSCIRPEISRTKTFGKEGTSGGQFFDSHLDKIVLNDVPILWRNVDVSFLQKAAYDRALEQETRSCITVPVDRLLNAQPSSLGPLVCVEFASFADFQRLARALDIMDDEKNGVPRGAYESIVPLRFRGHKVLLKPSAGNSLYVNTRS